MQRTLLVSAVAFLTTLSAQAQGWVGKYAPERMMGINGIRQRPDGNYLITGFNLNSNDTTRLMLIGATGNVLAAIDHDSLTSITATAQTGDGGFAIMGTRTEPAYDGMIRSVLRVDGDGLELWHADVDSFPTPPEGGLLGNIAIDEAPDGGFFCVNHPYDAAMGQRILQVTRLDANGTIVWKRSYYDNDPTTFNYLIECTPDGGALVNLALTDNTTDLLFKIDAAGDVLWAHDPAEDLTFLYHVVAADGNILAHGTLPDGATVIKKLDQDGNQLWSQTYPLFDGGLSFTNLVEVAADEFVGLGIRYVGEQSYMSLIRLDDAGNILQQRPLPLANLGMGLNNLFITHRMLTPTSDGGYLCGGWIEANTAFPHTGFLIKMDAEGQVYPGLLSGVPFSDNGDCIQDAGEPALNGTILSFSNGAEQYHVAATEGFYMLGLGNGNYTVDLTPPSPYWQPSTCTPTTVALPASGDTVISFGFTPLVTAPYLEMDGYARNRLCMANTYTLRYCNTGTTAFTGVIQIKFDTLLTVDSASVPWANNSNGFVLFTDGGLGISECRTIQVHFTTPCDLDLMGRTLCIEARAFPNTMYLPGPTWDASNLTIAVEHDLATDSVEFTVYNTGAEMMSAQDLMIHQNDGQYASLPVQLAGNTSVTHAFPANGSTWRGTIAQTEGNPYAAFATVALEGAGLNEQGDISLGFVDDFPLYGQYAFHHTACTPILNSYDPNRKSVTPEGIGEERWVDSTATLEYTLEFQNTGTAEAYVVRLVDTLTTHLDPRTLTPGASSHPYTWRFLAHNVVEFLFEDINLPDSTTNEPASHGFVRFRIEQLAGNPQGTIIDNEVGIYFDFNPPVITNTATVTVGRPLVTEVTAVEGLRMGLRAYPNPFNMSTIIEVNGHGQRELTLTVLDATGRVVKRQGALNTDRFVLDRNDLSSGQYTFEVRGEQGVIGHGRIVVQ